MTETMTAVDIRKAMHSCRLRINGARKELVSLPENDPCVDDQKGWLDIIAANEARLAELRSQITPDLFASKTAQKNVRLAIEAWATAALKDDADVAAYIRGSGDQWLSHAFETQDRADRRRK